MQALRISCILDSNSFLSLWLWLRCFSFDSLFFQFCSCQCSGYTGRFIWNRIENRCLEAWLYGLNFHISKKVWSKHEMVESSSIWNARFFEVYEQRLFQEGMVEGRKGAWQFIWQSIRFMSLYVWACNEMVYPWCLEKI